MKYMEYETKDFPLVSFLTYLGYSSTMRKEGTVCYFKFSGLKQEDIDSYWNGTALIEPKQFFFAMNTVKSRVHS